MPQTSTLYAVARLKMLRRHFLSVSQMQRLLSAPDDAQARQILVEANYLEGEQADWEEAARERLLAASLMLRKLTPQPDVSDAFLLRHDIHNLKTLFKARILNTEPEGISLCGTLDPQMLRHAVADHRYGALPPALRATMEALEKQAALKVDPMAIDVLLDQTLFSLLHGALSKGPSPAARAWLRRKADFANLLAFIRLRRMSATLSFSQVLLPGGGIDKARLAALESQPDKLLGLYQAAYGRKLTAMARAAMEDSAHTAPLERELENLTLAPFAGVSRQIDSLDAVLDYLLSLERETASVRLIMTGKRNGLSRQAIEERLRVSYGG
ncbi:MAG: V-type ATPase subunit [Christensenellales bacterium]